MRAQRLLDLTDVLRRAKGPVTADSLAAKLEVTPRTIYRDVVTLVDMGTPIRGERGVGYVLERGHHLPPLTFDNAELEAFVLGMRMAEAYGDPATTEAARSVLAKVEHVLPRSRREELLQAPLYAYAFDTDTLDLAPLRAAFKTQSKADLQYGDAHGNSTHRVVWPLSLAFVSGAWSLVAYCELRADFRHFRLDRIGAFTVLDAAYDGKRLGHLADWKRQREAELAARNQ